MSGTGIFWGRSSSLGRNRCALVVPMPGWCWVRASLTMAFWKYLWERQSATLNIFHLLLVLSCLFSWERVMGTVYLVRIRIWKRSQLKTGFAVRGPKLSQAIVSPTFQSCFGVESCINNLPLAVNSRLWARSWEEPLDTHPSPGMLKCPLVQCFAALFISYFEMFFSREKRQLLSLDWSWIVIPQSNVTTSQMRLDSCFLNIVYVCILYTVIKLGFHYWKRSAVSLPPPAVNGKCCSQNSTCHILFSRTGRILRYTGFFPRVRFNMYFV